MTGTAERAPASADVTRRPAGPRDDRYLRALFTETRDDLLILPPDVRDALVDMQFRAQRQRFRTSHPEATHEVLVADGEDAGCLVVDASGPEVRVVDITVARCHRRRRVASRVLRDVIAEAGDRPVTLRVWAADTAARALYDTLGFVPQGSGHGYLTMERRAA